MVIAFLVGIIILIGELLGHTFEPIVIFGRSFSWTVFTIPFVFPLRDLAQERHGRVAIFFGMVLASAAFGLFAPPYYALYGSIAFICAELFGWICYGAVRQYGWFPAMVIADVVATPTVIFLFSFLKRGNVHHYHTYDLPAQWLTLCVGFAIMTGVPPIRRLFHGPAIEERK